MLWRQNSPPQVGWPTVWSQSGELQVEQGKAEWQIINFKSTPEYIFHHSEKQDQQLLRSAQGKAESHIFNYKSTLKAFISFPVSVPRFCVRTPRIAKASPLQNQIACFRDSEFILYEILKLRQYNPPARQLSLFCLSWPNWLGCLAGISHAIDASIL